MALGGVSWVCLPPSGKRKSLDIFRKRVEFLGKRGTNHLEKLDLQRFLLGFYLFYLFILVWDEEDVLDYHHFPLGK